MKFRFSFKVSQYLPCFVTIKFESAIKNTGRLNRWLCKCDTAFKVPVIIAKMWEWVFFSERKGVSRTEGWMDNYCTIMNQKLLTGRKNQHVKNVLEKRLCFFWTFVWYESVPLNVLSFWRPFLFYPHLASLSSSAHAAADRVAQWGRTLRSSCGFL